MVLFPNPLTATRAYHSYMVEVVDEEDGAQLLGLEAARKLHEKVHACIAHAIQVMVQLAILHMSTTNCWSHRHQCTIQACQFSDRPSFHVERQICFV